jgi:hypothetical protein
VRFRVWGGLLGLFREAIVAEDLSGSQVVGGIDGRREAFLRTAVDFLHYGRSE